MTTEKAPVAGQTTGASSTQQRRGDEELLRALGAGRSSGGFPQALPSVSEISDILRSGNSAQSRASALQNLLSGDGGMGSGAAAAAGVLTAVDEDGEGDEEAPVPGEFDYHSDNEDDE